MAVPAAVVVAAGAMLASPLVAEAAVTPSLRNFFYSLAAGATVLAAIAGAVTAGALSLLRLVGGAFGNLALTDHLALSQCQTTIP